MSEQNKLVVKEFMEKVWKEGQYELVPNYLDKNYRAYSLKSGHIIEGTNGVLKNVQGVHKAYPNFRIIIQDMFGEEDRVVTRLTMLSTQESKEITFQEIIIHRLENYKIVEAWAIGTGWSYNWKVYLIGKTHCEITSELQN